MGDFSDTCPTTCPTACPTDRADHVRAVPPVRGAAGAATLAAVLAAGLPAAAATLGIRPITLVGEPGMSVTVTGTVTTGATPGILTDWSIAVTTVETLARFTPANTPLRTVSGVTAAGGVLGVQTASDPVAADGGTLAFRAANPFLDVGVTLADFADPAAPDGQAMYMSGPAFDFLSLGQPFAAVYQAGQSPGGNVFSLTPLSFPGGVSLTGTITTDGTSGALSAGNILSWDISVAQTIIDLFDSSNSTVQSSGLGLSPNGVDLAVTNPGGYLGFSKGTAGGRPYSVMLADFGDPLPYGGQAGYFQGRLQVLTIPLGARRGPWDVTGSMPVVAAVPLPPGLAALSFGLAALGLLRRRRRPATA